jgi:hypothetical protein
MAGTTTESPRCRAADVRNWKCGGHQTIRGQFQDRVWSIIESGSERCRWYMNPNNHPYDVRFFLGLITVIACAGFLFYSLIITVTTKLGTVAGAIDLFCSFLGLWALSNIAANYRFKYPARARLAKNEIQFAIAVSACVVILLLSIF